MPRSSKSFKVTFSNHAAGMGITWDSGPLLLTEDPEIAIERNMTLTIIPRRLETMKQGLGGRKYLPRDGDRGRESLQCL